MIPTFQALAVTLFAVLPGALYTFACERMAGSFGVGLSDRIFRFLAASAVLHVILSGATYHYYTIWIVTGELALGQINWWWVEILALIYVIIPIAAGSLVGWGCQRKYPWAVALRGSSPEPRAWDFLWRQDTAALIRLKTKSGSWLAGVFAGLDGLRSYASGYPEEGDLFLSRQVLIDSENGAYNLDENGECQFVPDRSGLLIRWDEIEFLEYKEWVMQSE